MNDQLDSLTHLARLTVEGEEEKWEHLLEWLHVKRGHSGSKDLFKEAVSRVWSVTRKLYNTIISVCGLCRTGLGEHNPLKDQLLHLRDNKGQYGTPGRWIILLLSGFLRGNAMYWWELK